MDVGCGVVGPATHLLRSTRRDSSLSRHSFKLGISVHLELQAAGSCAFHMHAGTKHLNRGLGLGGAPTAAVGVFIGDSDSEPRVASSGVRFKFRFCILTRSLPVRPRRQPRLLRASPGAPTKRVSDASWQFTSPSPRRLTVRGVPSGLGCMRSHCQRARACSSKKWPTGSIC